MTLDTTYDFWQSCPRGGDPDSRCHALRKYHQVLWGRPLPDGRMISLVDIYPDGYLELQVDGLSLKLTSDSVIPTYKLWKRAKDKRIREGIDPQRLDAFETLSGTIGGITLFPGYTVNGAGTINMQRGRSSAIGDRMDLTLECIRLHYLGEDSPLAKTLALYPEFFDLFGGFEGYVEHFLFLDLIKDGRVQTFLPLDFSRPGMPQDSNEYKQFMENTTAFVQSRNARIAALQLSIPADTNVKACGSRCCAIK